MTTAAQPYKKKLIETSLPLEAINRESAREKKLRHGHPSTLHLWWSRKPLATARAILFAQLVDDPSARPEEFPTVEEQDAERKRLHALMEELVVWENSNDERILRAAHEEILKSNNGTPPPLLDPFAGGGSIPLEAQRLGLEAHASDLNPLAVLINKALIEIPPKFADMPPIHPGPKEKVEYRGAEGLAEDVRYYGKWMRDEAEKRIGHLYPKVKGPDGTEHTVIAWKWARTVKSPNPANPIETPLVNSWWLSKKKGKEAWIKPEVIERGIHFRVVYSKDGPTPDNDGTIKHGKGAFSISDGTPFDYSYIREEGRHGRIGSTLLAIIAETKSGRLYLDPDESHCQAANIDRPSNVIHGSIDTNPRWFSPPSYGLTEFEDLFTNRQLHLFQELSNLLDDVEKKINKLIETDYDLLDYADAVRTYLALSISRTADYSSNICTWNSSRDIIRNVFSRQAIPMSWDYAESNPFSNSSGNFLGQANWIAKAIENVPTNRSAIVSQQDAESRHYHGLTISTDPPYYDNIGYSDLSDFFYVWNKKNLSKTYPPLYNTILSPKSTELVANPHRRGDKEQAKEFFIDGFNSVFSKIKLQYSSGCPISIYYAYKQKESNGDSSSFTGWHTLLHGLISGGWEITATWPLRSELTSRMTALGSNSLASSIVLACRPRPEDAPSTTRRAFIAKLKQELPEALRTLMQGTIAPVDLAQAAIGPGISVFSRYSRVREADGTDMDVRQALQIINATLDEVLGEQESDFDPETRFAVKWYRQYGWAQESSGIADQLARASDTSITGLERGGIFEAKGGKARLLPPTELSGDWDPSTDDRVSIWEATIRLAGVMTEGGMEKVAQLLPAVQGRVSLDAVKELGFLLFHEAEKKQESQDALHFNGLVTAWGDVTEQSRRYANQPKTDQQTLDFDGE